MKERKVVTTADGSKSILIPDWDEHYHSHHGALQESELVYIAQGLSTCPGPEVQILEMGFGTGLNALLSLRFALERGLEVRYHAIEAFPLKESEWEQLQYPQLLGMDEQIFFDLHHRAWDEEEEILPGFKLKKFHTKLEYFQSPEQYDLVYFDAFGPRVQEELWNLWAFELMYEQMRSGAVLVTYSSKGTVRRNMITAGFQVEKCPGPPGKREMLRAQK